jgi:glycosyltransferase involved in cell wall biosynthesis
MKILFIDIGLHNKNRNALLKYNLIIDAIYHTNLDLIDLTQYNIVYSPHIPIDVSKYPHTKFIFGPHFSVFPEKHQMDIVTQSKNVVYIQPSDWAKSVWAKNSLCDGIRIEILPFGVDTDTFTPNKPICERDKVFIYCKRRQPKELYILRELLEKFNVSYKMFDYLNKYSEEDYIDYLKQSKFGIWLDAHESQGFALEEALSCDVPLLVWNVKSMDQEYRSNYVVIPATTIPYWDHRCGEYFYNDYELENTYNKFITKLRIDTYKPREYILENLSIKKCQEKFVNLINNI